MELAFGENLVLSTFDYVAGEFGQNKTLPKILATICCFYWLITVYYNRQIGLVLALSAGE